MLHIVVVHSSIKECCCFEDFNATDKKECACTHFFQFFLRFGVKRHTEAHFCAAVPPYVCSYSKFEPSRAVSTICRIIACILVLYSLIWNERKEAALYIFSLLFVLVLDYTRP